MKKPPSNLKENPFRYSIGTRVRDKPFLKLLQPNQNDRILDIGCGLGYFSELLSKRGARVWGVDADAASIAFSTRNIKGNFVIGRAESLPFKANAFDKILCSEVLEHIQDDERALAEIFRVGRSGATVVITTPALEGVFGSKIKRVAHQTVSDSSREFHYRDGYKADTLISLMRNHGIKIDEVKYTMVFFVELLMGLTKVSYSLQGKNLERQADVLSVRNSLIFRFYKKLFPLMLFINSVDEFLPKILKGHMLIIKGTLEKSKLELDRG
ncbi:Ubiquinone biosynthesis O-methyltransferase [subsurface metagenome]